MSERARLLVGTDDTLSAMLQEPCTLLILTRADCTYCAAYQGEIVALLQQDVLRGVTVGLVLLDRPGVGRFKRANPWIARLSYLPYNLLYQHGQPVDGFAASNAGYLSRRLQARLRAPTAAPPPTSGGES